MCSLTKYSTYSTNEALKSLLTICVEYILCHVDLYSNYFPILPVHIKNRILKRLTSIKLNYLNITKIFKTLIHPQLKHIDFSLVELDDNLLKSLVICKEMRELILTRDENTLLTEKCLIETVINFNKLLILQVENCIAVSDDVIENIIDNCPKISELDIAGCSNISDSSLIYISKLNNLTALNMSRTKITNIGIKIFVAGASRNIIKELRIADCPNISYKAINLICEFCNALEVFIFNNSTSPSDQTNVNFDNANFKKLKQLTWTVYW